MKSLFTPGKPKSANVLGAVNKPLSSAGRQSQSKFSRMETISNASSGSNPSSPGRIKGRLDSTELDHSENEDYTMMASPLSGKKTDKRDDSDLIRSELEKPRSRKKTLVDPEEKMNLDELCKLGQEQKLKGGQRGRKRTAVASESDEPWPEEKRLKEDLLENEDEQNSPPKKGRRGRPPKAAKGTTPKEDTAVKPAKRGRRKAQQLATDKEEMEEEQVSENLEQKRRGRQPKMPRKAQQRLATSECLADESPQSTPHKKRGRPPKTPPSQNKKNVHSGRYKQAASKENESDEDMDMAQCSPSLNDDIPQEEDDQESTLNVRRKISRRARP
ncbi:sister chromatid cohesion protein PDS5 homolog B-like [Microcaecilia unicolor]|uniref:Sister chromatid cohesion protein PDS5 homolog B-like n=1 Tax=Microcaecilia unicolor TaxID=1415580 RepID=A0A6P7XT58_9AMPH|nr:sister chromatid cohesion protein PDS5 homolog B-like [Microcaecilia unicolor]